MSLQTNLYAFDILNWYLQAKHYSTFLIIWSGHKRAKSFIDSSILKKENDFFEILILLTVKILEPFFEFDNWGYIQDGISLFYP